LVFTITGSGHLAALHYSSTKRVAVSELAHAAAVRLYKGPVLAFRADRYAIPVKPANGMVRPCSFPAGKGRQEEHAMSQQISTTIAVMGIDIGKNSFHV
jgi:hypothetical protein